MYIGRQSGSPSSGPRSLSERPMLKYSWLPKLAAVGLGCVVVGCGGSARQGQVRTTPPPPPSPVTADFRPVQAPAPPAVDPVQTLIDDSQRPYEQGKRHLDP